MKKNPLAALPQTSRTPFLVMLAAIIIVIGYAAIVGKPATGPDGKPPRTAAELAALDISVRDLILQKYGGESQDQAQKELVARIGTAIATRSEAKDDAIRLRFTLLADPNAINSFALPTGDIFITTALLNRMRTEGETAAVLASSAAHVLMRHHMELPDAPAPLIPAFNAAQESAADSRALKIMSDSGYNPTAMLGMFEVLTAAYSAGADAQFFASHPSADGRIEAIHAAIAKLFPKGIPEILSK